jgi:hypothetical protein
VSFFFDGAPAAKVGAKLSGDGAVILAYIREFTTSRDGQELSRRLGG